MAEMNVALRACERELSGAFTTKVRFRLDRGRTIVNDTSLLPTGTMGRLAIALSALLVATTLIAIGALIANAMMSP